MLLKQSHCALYKVLPKSRKKISKPKPVTKQEVNSMIVLILLLPPDTLACVVNASWEENYAENTNHPSCKPLVETRLFTHFFFFFFFFSVTEYLH